MLVRFDPYREFDLATGQLRDDRRVRVMPMDAYRVGDVLHVELDVPGVKPDSIEITVEKNVLSVKAERRWDDEEAETVVCERPQGTFGRELFLGESLDTEKVQASYRDGVLRLAIPIAEQAKARRIEVKASPEEDALMASTPA